MSIIKSRFFFCIFTKHYLQLFTGPATPENSSVPFLLSTSTRNAFINNTANQMRRPERHLQWTLMNSKPEVRLSLLSNILSSQHQHYQEQKSQFFSSSASGGSSLSLINVDRLLIRRSPVATDQLQSFSWSSAFVQIMRVLFRGILETVRETRFSVSGNIKVKTEK